MTRVRSDRLTPLERMVQYFLDAPLPATEAALASVTAIVKTRRLREAATEEPRRRRTRGADVPLPLEGAKS